jgi:hypothetical protein
MNFLNFIKESIGLKYHDTLNPFLWNKANNDYALKEEIEKKLLMIADEWIKFAKIPKESITDVILTGSMCNFNYTKYSDIDVHIIIEKEKLLPKQQWNMPFGNKTIVGNIIDDYLRSKKQLWSIKHNIVISGYNVELYAQGNHELYSENAGVYSLTQKKWIIKPIKGNYNFNNNQLINKVILWKKKIDDTILSGSLKEIDDLKTRLKNMRKSAIEKGGEFADENLIFKSLRNTGYLMKLTNYQRTVFDKELSL